VFFSEHSVCENLFASYIFFTYMLTYDDTHMSTYTLYIIYVFIILWGIYNSLCHTHDAYNSFAGNFCVCASMASHFLRAKAKCFARLCHRLGVCPSVRLSVRLSVTLVSCIKTVHARITKFSLWAAPRSLVYRDRISCHCAQGFPSNEGVEEGYPPKKCHFAVIGSNNVKTVADRYIHAE